MGKRYETIYMHFSFRKPKDAEYALFGQVCFADTDFRKRIMYNVKPDKLWVPESQHINSIQSYIEALDYIFKIQSDALNAGFKRVMLVTNNSSLSNWILGKGRNKYYNSIVDDAIEPYRFGAPKALNIGVGLMEPVENEKAKRFCISKYCPELDEFKARLEAENKTKNYVINTNKNCEEPVHKTIFDVMGENEIKTDGMTEV